MHQIVFLAHRSPQSNSRSVIYIVNVYAVCEVNDDKLGIH